jgi:type VI secretion system secreted protein VgrG
VGKALSITAMDQITLETGLSCIVLKKDGTISIKGMSVSIVGIKSVESVGQNIKSTADVANKIAGTMVNLEANGIATVKGSLVKVN